MADRVGVAIVGVGGAVATTAIAGIEMIRAGSNSRDGLPLADRAIERMVPYEALHFAGWDLADDDLAAAALKHGVLDEAELSNGASSLRRMRPWPAFGSRSFCANIDGPNKMAATGHRAAVAQIQTDLARFKADEGLDRVVMVNLASTERPPRAAVETLTSADAFERALDSDDAEVGPAMLYAYAAIDAGTPYANFAPSVAADAPVLQALAARRGVPIAGKDGKTGQTLIKTVIAPALKARALHVDGWFSTNLLGNRDGLALDDEGSLKSKVDTKSTALAAMLGYPVDDQVVMIHYYRPRGDDKEAWDNIDISGFLGRKMQLKMNFLCKDSILAAPLVIEIARVLDLAAQRGEGGVQDQMSLFFKAPQTANGAAVHGFGDQQEMLDRWLDA